MKQSTDPTCICQWHELLAEKVTNKKGNVKQVYELCEAEQAFWENMNELQHRVKIKTSCLLHRRQYANSCNETNVLLTEIDCEPSNGPIYSRTLFFKTLLEDGLARKLEGEVNSPIDDDIIRLFLAPMCGSHEKPALIESKSKKVRYNGLTFLTSDNLKIDKSAGRIFFQNIVNEESPELPIVDDGEDRET